MYRSSEVKLPFRSYSLFPSARYIIAKCDICEERGGIYGGYFCNDPNVWFHKECVELPSEINLPFHPQHPLSLIHKSQRLTWSCDLCGELPGEYYYSCLICKLSVDITCVRKPLPPAVEHPICHDHPLVLLNKSEEVEAPCEVCKDLVGSRSYTCRKCDVFFHKECALLSKEINYPFHSNHPLKLTSSQSLKDHDVKKICDMCGRPLRNCKFYYCSTCKFFACFGCIETPPPIVMENAKTHKHPLTILFRDGVLCTCNVCGVKDNMTPYICLQCGFAVHGKCIDLPQVININRHDHRISFTHHLGLGNLKCGVCRKGVCQYNGAYSCSVCPNYALHSFCATRYDVWDGADLEGKPENIEDFAPFKVVGDELIRHFSHEKHTLRLHQSYTIHDDSARCEACSYPVGFDPIYKCEECCFILHEKCANLPMKKRLIFSNSPCLLLGPGNGIREALNCKLCGVLFTGFKYKSQRMQEDMDVHCSSLSEPFIHVGHSHPLYFDKNQLERRCDACHKTIYRYMYMLSCDDCEFNLCLHCASLPVKIRHRNDEHPLSLCCGEKANGKYWCDICEEELDPSKWFYTCFDCGVTLHAKCVLGDFSRLMPRCFVDFKGFQLEVVLNNHNTRPICTWCHSRCKVSVILKASNMGRPEVFYLCSGTCFSYFLVLGRPTKISMKRNY